MNDPITIRRLYGRRQGHALRAGQAALVEELLPRIAGALDEPLGDSSCLPTWLLSEFTREHVTVALSGDGGDELFGGYGRYRETLREEADWMMRARYLVRNRRA